MGIERETSDNSVSFFLVAAAYAGVERFFVETAAIIAAAVDERRSLLEENDIWDRAPPPAPVVSWAGDSRAAAAATATAEPRRRLTPLVLSADAVPFCPIDDVEGRQRPQVFSFF